jgi:signal transduction histidine kinase
LQAGLGCALQAAEMVRRLVAFAFRPAEYPAAALVWPAALAENTARRVRDQHLPGLTVVVSNTSAALVRGNAVLLQLALDQLVDNALEAMPQGGTLTLRVHDDGPAVCLGVTDTGGGLSAEARAHLFEPFVTTKCAGHLGLGLVLCRDLVQAQGGSLELHADAGAGTTATLRFPTSAPLAPETLLSAAQKRTADPPQSDDALWHSI